MESYASQNQRKTEANGSAAACNAQQLPTGFQVHGSDVPCPDIRALKALKAIFHARMLIIITCI